MLGTGMGATLFGAVIGDCFPKPGIWIGAVVGLALGLWLAYYNHTRDAK